MKTIFAHKGRVTVLIGGLEYRIVEMPDGKVWMAENLALPLPSFGSKNNGKYYDSVWANFPTYNDNSQGYGILYWLQGILKNTDGCRTYLEGFLPSGWRIPTLADIQALTASVDGWEDLANAGEGGNDKYGFNAKCAGVSARDWNYVNSQGYPDGESNIMIDDSNYNTLTIYHPNDPTRRLAPFWLNVAYRIPIRLVRG